MKCKTMRHEIIEFQWMTLLLLFTICFSSCKDDKDASAEPYDPSQPVTVTDFAPKAGGANTRMIIYGSNFGTDSSIVFVKIGGKEAKVINAKGNSLYCITPQQCYEGTIEVKVGEQDVIVSSKYKYVPQKVVSTLCGYVDEKGNGEIIKEGPFSDCGKIDFPALVKMMRKVKYTGMCSLEYEKDMSDPFMGIAESIGYFKAVSDLS